MNSLETLVLELIGEDPSNPDVFVDTPAGMEPIRDSLNAAIQEIAALTGSYERTYHVTSRADRMIYRIRSQDTFGYVVEMWDRARHRKLTGTSIWALAQDDPGFMSTGGPPTTYFPVGNDAMGFYPVPNVTGTVYEARCVMIPASYAVDTDPIQLRKTFEHAAAHFAVSEFYASRGDAKRAAAAWSEYISFAGLDLLLPQQADAQWQMGSKYGRVS